MMVVLFILFILGGVVTVWRWHQAVFWSELKPGCLFFLNAQPPNLSWDNLDDIIGGYFSSHQSQMTLHNCEMELLFSVYHIFFFIYIYIHTSTITANKKFPHSPTCHLQEGRHEKFFPAGSSYLQHIWYVWRQLQSTWTVYSQSSSHAN